MTPQTVRFALMGLCAGLAAVIAVELIPAAHGSGGRAAIPARNQAAIAVNAAPPNVDALIAEVLARPLFSPARLPRTEEVAEAPEHEGPPELQSRLTGIMIGPEGREALFERGAGEPVSVKEGDEIDGWKVAVIRSEQVILKSDFGEQVVAPTDGESAGAPARAVAKKKPVATKINATKAAAPGGKPPSQAATPKAQAPQASALQRGRQGAK